MKHKRCDSEKFISSNDDAERSAMGFIYLTERRGKRARWWRDRERVCER